MGILLAPAKPYELLFCVWWGTGAPSPPPPPPQGIGQAWHPLIPHFGILNAISALSLGSSLALLADANALCQHESARALRTGDDAVTGGFLRNHSTLPPPLSHRGGFNDP